MARNQEKAQSMLYRFREAQAMSLGLTPKPTRRPRLASSVSSLKECERWRGEVIREISRKVTKIQDTGLSDYEVRDLNDEINKLIREKGYWEDQILALGGANYKRGVPSMLGGGDQGMVSRGGYKYFGRAKDLPGVKELFEGKARKEAEAEAEREDRYKAFRNLPPSYYGDEDEDDGVLLAEEKEEEEKEWRERYTNLMKGLTRDLRRREARAAEAEEMDVDDDDVDMDESQIPAIPRPDPQPWKESMAAFSESFNAQYTHPQEQETAESAKRPNDSDEPTPEEAASKRQKASDGSAVPQDASHTTTAPSTAPAAASVGYSIFSAQDLEVPTVPDRAAIEKMILQAKKKQLRQEYVGS